MPLEALIFDVDGTLAETEELHRAAFNATFGTFWLDWHWDEALYRELLKVTGGKERIRHYIEGWNPAGATMALARLGDIHAEKNAHYASFMEKKQVIARPGVLRLIREARARKITLAIATTTSLPNVEALLKSLLGPASLSWFRVIGAGDQVKAKKPAPDVYNHVLTALGCPAAHCIAFEDSRNGIEAARQAGVTIVATPSFYSGQEDFSGAATVLSDLGEPGKPFRHLGGAALPKSYVDIDSLEQLLALACLA